MLSAVYAETLEQEKKNVATQTELLQRFGSSRSRFPYYVYLILSLLN
jgi:hypothetical protein